MAELFLEIITPSKKIFGEKIKSVTIPGTNGSFQVLINHAPLMSTFEIGLIKIEPFDKTIYFATGGGTVEVLDNKVLVLADSIEAPEKIDVDRALAAKERAEQRLASKEKDLDVPRAQAALARALNRLKIADKFAETSG
jgi:F-type H+-transporting ATPase subunit epsilon